jgi:hypothetical protein
MDLSLHAFAGLREACSYPVFKHYMPRFYGAYDDCTRFGAVMVKPVYDLPYETRAASVCFSSSNRSLSQNEKCDRALFRIPSWL